MTLVDAKLPDLDDTTKALRLPVGISSPLWLMIGSAAMVGAAMFWATRWASPLKAAGPQPEAKVLPRPEPEVEAALEKAAETVVETAETVSEAVVELPVAVAEAVLEAAPEPEPEIVIDPVVAAPVVAAPDDLTVMTGIGPKMAALLAEKGVTTFAQIAAWTEDEIAVLDKELKLMGRVAREAWVAQAKRLAGG